MASGEATRRSGAGGSWRDASVNAPVRTRSATEQRSLSTAMWCRGISLVVLVVGTGVGVLYASAKMRFVEDVLPKISGTYLDCFGVPQNPRRMNPSLILPTSLGGSSRCENFGKEWHFSFANVTHPVSQLQNQTRSRSGRSTCSSRALPSCLGQRAPRQSRRGLFTARRSAWRWWARRARWARALVS
jgi:hypothetical protein